MTTGSGPAAFGTVAVAMVTPFDANGKLDLDGAAGLADRLVSGGCDGLVVSGTTGESPTTSDSEKSELLRAVVEGSAGRAKVIAGVGTNDTAHTLELAREAERAGADALLVVTPYYSKPSQAGLVAHFSTVADSTELPVMLYDIPGRSGIPIATETLLRLAEHDRILAVKDAKGDLYAAAEVMAATDLDYYSGDDPLNLPWLAMGAVGFVSVLGHWAPDRLAEMLASWNRGDTARAREINTSLLPLMRALHRFGGVCAVKAGLRLLGTDLGDPRLPQVPVDGADLELLAGDLAAAGVAA